MSKIELPDLDPETMPGENGSALHLGLRLELENMSQLLNQQMDEYFGAKKSIERTDRISALLCQTKEDGKVQDPYVHYVNQNGLCFEERMILLLSLIPHILPYYWVNSEFGEKKTKLIHFLPSAVFQVSPDSVALATVQTAIFLLFGVTSLEGQIYARRWLSIEGHLFKSGILKVRVLRPQEPWHFGLLQISQDALKEILTGEPAKPDFGPDFPASLQSTKLEWEDLVLPHATKREVEEIKDWMIHKQKILQEWGMERVLKQGYRALFYGPPGTGKTLTATLLGKYLNQDVYRIDLSQVVSKFIGETEKNLGRIFDRAEHKNWILFFDEADALFGKRTKVNDAHDRFANQEVSFLLQRVEDYNGIIILASNKRENVDEAFSRRFQSIVHFPLPGASERTALWKQILPAACKLERGLTHEQVAKEFEVAGGAMLNAARHAVLMAACRGDAVIRKRELAEGIRRELRKDGRML